MAAFTLYPPETQQFMFVHCGGHYERGVKFQECHFTAAQVPSKTSNNLQRDLPNTWSSNCSCPRTRYPWFISTGRLWPQRQGLLSRDHKKGGRGLRGTRCNPLGRKLNVQKCFQMWKLVPLSIQNVRVLHEKPSRLECLTWKLKFRWKSETNIKEWKIYICSLCSMCFCTLVDAFNGSFHVHDHSF